MPKELAVTHPSKSGPSASLVRSPDARPSAAPESPERAVILRCLGRIRRRLWIVRLAERLALAFAWGASLAVVVGCARLLRERYPLWAALGAAVPLVGAVWLWMRSRQPSNSGSPVLSPALLRAAAVLTAIAAAAGVLIMLAPWGGAIAPWHVVAGTVLLFAAAAIAAIRPVSLQTAAIFVDQRAGLEERVSTALELLETEAASPMEAAFREPVIESAVAACHQVKRARVGYRHLDERAYAIAATAALAAVGVCFLTPLPSLARPQQRKYVQVIDSARHLSDALKEAEKKKLPNDTVTAEKVKPLESALSQLKKGEMSPIDASALLDSARQQMQKEDEAMSASEKVRDLLSGLEQTKDLAAASDPMKDARMKEAAGDTAAAQQRQAAQQAMEQASRGLAEKVGGGMSPDDKQKLANGLRDAAAQAGKSGDSQLQKDLSSAASDVEKGDTSKLAGDLNSAGQRMGQQRADRALSQEAVKSAMAEIDRMQQQGLSAGEQAAGQSGQNNQGGSQGDSGDQQGGGGQSGSGSQASGSPGGNQQGQQGGGGQGQSAQNAGQQGDGKGNGQGQGQQTAQTGGGKGGANGQAENGSGSTDFYQPGGPGDKKEGGSIGKERTFVRIYDEHDVKTAGKEERVGGQINPLAGPASGTMEIKGEAERGKSRIVSYRDSIPPARQRAMDDLNKQEIPPQYQEMVKTFYGE
jgi:hypothetical protein